MPGELLTFFVLTKQHNGDSIIRHLKLDNDVQQQLSAHFIGEYRRNWTGIDIQVKNYALTLLSDDHLVQRINDFKISNEIERALTNPIHFPAFRLPIPVDESIKGIFGCSNDWSLFQESIIFFQVCDTRNLLRNKFALFQTNEVFRKFDENALAIGDTLSGYFHGSNLYFKSLSWIGRMLDVTNYVAEATKEQAKALFGHTKFKLPDSHTLDSYIELLTPAMKKRVTIVLKANTMDSPDVTPDKISGYSEKYISKKFSLKGNFADRKLLLPTDPAHIWALLECLEEKYFTSELTHKMRETNSYSNLP